MSYGLAIIGFGGMGGWHCQNITERVSEIKVLGGYDIRQEQQDKLTEMGLKAYDNAKAILDDPAVDIVTVATPNNFHKDYVIACLRAGKNVVCEKPVTMNSAELREIMAVAKETGKLFSIHQNRRWDKDYNIVKKVIEDGTIGKPYMIQSRVQGSRRALHGWRGYKVNGGGMVLDWGIHIIDQMLDLIDSKVVSVTAHLHQVFAPEVDDNFVAVVRFENGLTYILEVSMNCFVNLPRWHVSCENGTAVVENWQCDGKIVGLKKDGEVEWTDEIVYTEAGPTRSMAPRPSSTVEETPLPEVSVDWSDYYKNIVGVLDGKAKLIVKPEQALRVMTLVDAIFESERTGKSVEVNI